MTLKNFKVLGILLLLLAVFAVGGKKVSAAVEDGDVQYTIGVVVYNCLLYTSPSPRDCS